MEKLSKIFGDAVRDRRVQLDVSQDALAYVAEIDRGYVGRIERGEVNVTLEKAYRLARVMGCDIRDLLP